MKRMMLICQVRLYMCITHTRTHTHTHTHTTILILITGFHPSDEEELIGQERDALQESPSHAPSERPDSLEFPSLPLTHTSPPRPLTPSHLAGSGAESTGSIGGESQDSLSRPTFQPGGLSHDSHMRILSHDSHMMVT